MHLYELPFPFAFFKKTETPVGVRVGGGYLPPNTVFATEVFTNGTPLVWTTDTELLISDTAGPDVYVWLAYKLVEGRPDSGVWPAMKSALLTVLANYNYPMPNYDHDQATATIQQAAQTMENDMQETWNAIQAKSQQLGDPADYKVNPNNSVAVRFWPEGHERIPKIAVPTAAGIVLKKGYYDDVLTFVLGAFSLILPEQQRILLRFCIFLGYVNCKHIGHCYDGGDKPNDSIDERHTVPPFDEIKKVATYLLA